MPRSHPTRPEPASISLSSPPSSLNNSLFHLNLPSLSFHLPSHNNFRFNPHSHSVIPLALPFLNRRPRRPLLASFDSIVEEEEEQEVDNHHQHKQHTLDSTVDDRSINLRASSPLIVIDPSLPSSDLVANPFKIFQPIKSKSNNRGVRFQLDHQTFLTWSKDDYDR